MLCLEKYIVSILPKLHWRWALSYTVRGVEIVTASLDSSLLIHVTRAWKKFHTLIPFLDNCVKEIEIHTKISVLWFCHFGFSNSRVKRI